MQIITKYPLDKENKRNTKEIWRLIKEMKELFLREKLEHLKQAQAKRIFDLKEQDLLFKYLKRVLGAMKIL